MKRRVLRGARRGAAPAIAALVLTACSAGSERAPRAAADGYFLRAGSPVEARPTADGFTLVLGEGRAALMPRFPGEVARSDDLVVFAATGAPAPGALAAWGDVLPTYRVGTVAAPRFATPNLFVKPAGGTSPAVLDRFLAENDLTLAARLMLEDWVYVRTGGDPIEVARALVERGAAEAAEPSFFVKTELYDLSLLPMTDPFFADQWTLHSEGPFTTADGKGVIEGRDTAHVAEAWKLMVELGVARNVEDIGTGIRLALIDDGFDLHHEDLEGRYVATENFGDTVEPGNLFSNMTGAKNVHGTLVTGIAAAAGNNGVGLSGACPGCRLVAARISAEPTGGLAPDAYYDRVFGWVLAQNPDVINCSWGPDTTVAPSYYDDLVQRITRSGRRGRGTVVVFAAGNDGHDFAENGLASNPASITVGASNSRGERFGFSNFGAGLDVLAPTAGAETRSGFGGTRYIDRIWSTDNHLDPACLGAGEQPSNRCSDTAGLNPTSPAAGGDRWDGRYSFRFSHTSAAAPLVSGIVALMLETNPALTAGEVQDILHETADQVSPSQAGYDEDGFSTNYGYGRVNALRAVAGAYEAGGRSLPAGLAAEIERVSPCTRASCGGAARPPEPDGGTRGSPDAGRADAGRASSPDAGRADAGAASRDAGRASSPDAGRGSSDAGVRDREASSDDAGSSGSAEQEEPNEPSPPLEVGDPHDPPVATAGSAREGGGCSAVATRAGEHGLGSVVGLLIVLAARRRRHDGPAHRRARP